MRVRRSRCHPSSSEPLVMHPSPRWQDGKLCMDKEDIDQADTLPPIADILPTSTHRDDSYLCYLAAAIYRLQAANKHPRAAQPAGECVCLCVCVVCVRACASEFCVWCVCVCMQRLRVTDHQISRQAKSSRAHDSHLHKSFPLQCLARPYPLSLVCDH